MGSAHYSQLMSFIFVPMCKFLIIVNYMYLVKQVCRQKMFNDCMQTIGKGSAVHLCNSFLANGDFCRLLITFANSLDPVQDPNFRHPARFFETS